MNRRDIDAIWTDVFDDNATNTSAEGRLAGEVRATLRSMRDDAPECQLSGERVRDAILGGGAIRRTAQWPASLAWMGTGALATLLVLAGASLFYQRPEKQPEASSVVALDSPLDREPDPVREAIDSAATQPEADSKPAPGQPEPQPQPAARQIRPQPQNERINVAAESQPTEEEVAVLGAPVEPFTSAPPVAESARGMNFADAEEQEPQVVVVTADYQTETGANRAKEVSFDDEFVFRG